LNSTIAENPGKTAVVLTGVKAGSADAVRKNNGRRIGVKSIVSIVSIVSTVS
jgi:hypothetical protein